MLNFILSAKGKKEINPWQELFTEPIEKVYIIMKDRTGFKDSGYDEVKVHMSVGMLERRLKKFKDKNYGIKDIAIIIHNHFRNCDFSPEDRKQYRMLKKYGFNGLFLMYCHRTNKTYDIEDEGKSK